MSRTLLGLIGLAALGVSAILEVLFHDPSHDDLVWHAIPLFDFAFGFLGCALIVIVSKWIGHYFLQRDENYYEEEGER